jgi:hypothetical protein
LGETIMSYSEYLKNLAIAGNVEEETGPTVESVAGKTGVVTLEKTDVGLSNIDNTSDANKPISTATQTALNTIAGNVQSVATSITELDKLDVGLGNVDNTSDANKPISTATQSALDAKQDSSSLTKSSVGLGNVDNTSDANKPISTATQTALNLKQDVHSAPITLTASRDLTSADNDKTLVSNLTTAITLNAPLGLPSNFRVTVIQRNTGQITFTAAGGLRSAVGHNKTIGQYAIASIMPIATDEYVLAGMTTA